MQTKFILHGGFTPHVKQENDAFFSEMLKDAPDKSKILLVYFAAEDEDRVAVYREDDIEQFNKNRGEKVLSFETANEESFVAQIKKADVVYLHGGKTVKILDTLKKFPNLKETFSGKIIGADSAGANALCVIYYSVHSMGISDGLGVLPFKIICHYTEKYKGELDNMYSKLETILLKEYEYKVFVVKIAKRKKICTFQTFPLRKCRKL